METLGKLAMKSAAAYPDKVAVKDKDRSFTYREMMDTGLCTYSVFS